jgi:hypothetical protein
MQKLLIFTISYFSMIKHMITSSHKNFHNFISFIYLVMN